MLVVSMDGIHMGDHTVLVALGIDQRRRVVIETPKAFAASPMPTNLSILKCMNQFRLDYKPAVKAPLSFPGPKRPPPTVQR